MTFRELAEEPGRRATGMAQAEADAGHRERTVQMIRMGQLMASGHPADCAPGPAAYRATPSRSTPPPAGAEPRRGRRRETLRRRSPQGLLPYGFTQLSRMPEQ